MSRTVRWLLLVALVLTIVPLSAVTALADGGCGTAGCTTCGTWQEYPLYAGQTWQVGLIRVNNCAHKIGVEYVLFDSVTDGGWRLTETHLAVASSVAGLPQTKTGNPIPGAFPYSRIYENGVTTDAFCIDRPAGWTTGSKLYIAAHAVVNKPAVSHTETGSFCATSGPSTKLADAITPATLAWVHPGWNPNLREADTDAPSDIYLSAAWVWDAYKNPSPRNGDLVDLYQEFQIPDGAAVTAATLQIASDNAFSWKLNGGAATDVNLAGDWRAQTVFSYPTYVVDPNMSAWKKVYTYDVTNQISPLANALYVTGVNAAWDTDDPEVNPGGVIYRLCGTWTREVTDSLAANDSAWGGTVPFKGKNWAKYIEYTVQECCTVTCIAPYYPIQVVDFLQGRMKSGAPVLASRSNANGITSYDAAQLDTSFFSLGIGGWIEGMYGCRVPNGAGNDLVVVEDTWGAYQLEQAKVWVSQDGITWYYLGMANNLGRATGDSIHTWSYFDLSNAKQMDETTPATVDWIKYVKVQDASIVTASSPTNFDGYDLNTIRALQDGLTCQ